MSLEAALLKKAGATCPLPYPEKFKAAVKLVKDRETEGKTFKDENRLALFALEQQALVGSCKEPKPWGWNVVESAKWQAWSQLQDMAPVEAMRLYVRLLEDELPSWWDEYESGINSSQSSPHRELPVSSSIPESNGTPSSPAASPRRPAANGSSHSEASDTLKAQHKRKATSLSEAIQTVATPGQWASPMQSDSKHPPPRYEHAASLIGHSLYVIGGNCGGRYLNDVWVLSLDNLTWQLVTTSAKPLPPVGGGTFDEIESEVSTPLLGHKEDSSKPSSSALPPSAGHVLLAWGSNLLCIGGHTKAGTYSHLRKAKDAKVYMVIRVLDTHKHEWSIISPAGNAPPQRGGHSGTLVGSKVYLFGGEDAARRPQGDLFVLDLADMEWQSPEVTGTPPPARSAHAAAAYQQRYLLIFGGGSVANCFGDLYVLDTESMHWSCRATQGPPPAPRAGHAGDVLGDSWYIVGGGNNTSGCTDMVALDLTPLATSDQTDDPLIWSTVSQAESRSAIVSEGLTVEAVPYARCLLSFGGYNGKYQSALQVFRPEATHHQKASHQEQHEEQEPSKVMQAQTQSPQQARDPRNRPVALETPKDQYNKHLEAARTRSGPLSHKQPSPRHTSPANGMLEESSSQEAAGDMESEEEQSEEEATSSQVAALQEQMVSAMQRVSAAEKEAAAAKEAAGTELALMRRQLTSSQAALAEAEQRASDADAQLSDEQAKVMRLEVTVAEQQQQLGRMEELEKELQHYRKLNKEVEGGKPKPGGGIWGYIAGTPAT
ncbi:hypothetical protein WJX82_011651 [Trebouxia sp. C0006]